MLDTLQTFFASWKTKGTLKLPIIIYERLHNKLYDNFQFLHQEAKCELRVARREEEEGKILSILQNAFSNINRAIDIGEKSSSENKMYSLNHMKVTKSLILSNYLLKARKSDKLGDTIQVFYEAFVEESSLLEEDFLRKEDLDDVKNFMSYIVMNSEDMVLDSESKNKFGEIYYIRYGKHISI